MEMEMDASEAEEWTKNDKNFFLKHPVCSPWNPQKNYTIFVGHPVI